MTPGQTIRFRSCKIGPSLPLEKIAAYFRMQRSSSWRGYLELHGNHLQEILKRRNCDGLQVYLFDFGCITFVNFEEADSGLFLEFMEGLTEGIDYGMVARYSESHTVPVRHSEELRPWPESDAVYRYEESFIPIIAILLAKSAALTKIELDLEASLDESEKYIEYLRRGKLRMKQKALMGIVSGFLKFEYESIHNIRIFDRSVADELNLTLNGRRLYDAFAEYMELNDRFDVLQSKIGSLRSTMKTYHALSHKHIMTRLNICVIVLLGFFPVVTLIHMFWG